MDIDSRNAKFYNISNKKIRIIVKTIINATEKYGVYIYHVAKFNSVYLKFDDPRMGSVRIADHYSKKDHLKYTWNIRLDIKNSYINGNMNAYPVSDLNKFFDDLEDRFNSINVKPMDFSNLIIENSNKRLIHINCRSSIVKIEEDKIGEKGMKTKNIAAVLMDNCKTIGVKFSEGEKLYTYKTTEDFEIGEYVVVNTPRYHIQGEYSGLTIAIVSEVHKVPQIDVDSNINYQWIVQKVDMANYKDLNAREEKFNDHLLEMQQKSVKSNAINMLAENLGVDMDSIQDTVKLLNGGE